MLTNKVEKERKVKEFICEPAQYRYHDNDEVIALRRLFHKLHDWGVVELETQVKYESCSYSHPFPKMYYEYEQKLILTYNTPTRRKSINDVVEYIRGLKGMWCWKKGDYLEITYERRR
jgi:hypothetical protein